MLEKETKKDKWHPSILTAEVLEFCQAPERIMDGTLGDAGHTIALHRKFPGASVLAVELDPEMQERAMIRLKEEEMAFSQTDGDVLPVEAGIHLRAGSYAGVSCRNWFDFILLDLGVSTFHFRQAGRGFSFFDEALDMRFRPDGRPTAAEILNLSSPAALVQALAGTLEQKSAEKLARRLLAARPFHTAMDVARLFNFKSRRHHPATLLFQALRIAVNQEIKTLERALALLPHALRPGGRLAIISFHSGEDRPVKFCFKELGRNPAFRLLTAHAIKPAYAEIRQNRQARSARLRVIEKLADT